MTVAVALDALGADARLWHETALVLCAAGAVVPELRLTATELSWAADPSGLVASYARAVGLAATLLRQGTAETAAVGDALLEVRAAYMASDERARARFERLWRPGA